MKEASGMGFISHRPCRMNSDKKLLWADGHQGESAEDSCAGPYRVLQVVGGLNAGGIETLLMSIYRSIDRSVVQFDFLCGDSSPRYFYEDEIASLGGWVFRIRHGRKHPLMSRAAFVDFFRSHSYDIVHFHMGDMAYLVHLKQAFAAGVPTRILHSHCAFPVPHGPKERYSYACHVLNRAFCLDAATDCFACSADAARWFGFDSLPDSRDWTLIKNGIDVARFTFDPEKRASARAELGLADDEFCVGSVGRLSPQKNQLFLAEAFAELLRRRPRSRWLLVGGGELEGAILARCEELSVGDKVIHLKDRVDVDRFLCAMDAFAFPSIYEGLGIAFIEAQASGVPCIASDRVPSEAFVSSHAATLPVDRGARCWAEVLAGVPIGLRHEGTEKQVRAAGYDIAEIASSLADFYRRKHGENVRAGLCR